MIKPIAIIAGEPNSISSEIIFKSWKLRKKYFHKPFFVIGSISLLKIQMKKLKLKIKIKQSKLTIGSWLTIPNNSVTEIFATNNFDWLVIDLEHSSISLSEAAEMIRIIDLAGNTPLVRLTSNNEDQIKRILDAGAHGIIVPMVNSKDDVSKILKSVYYYPLGNRGVGLSRAQGYGENFKKYYS